jgi:NAD(P)H dehydrogenase (quinone)
VAGADAELVDLHADGFDPRLTTDEARGHPTRDPLVARYIAALREADLLAVVHPNCWGSPPALMKGWMDRTFAPGAAHAFAKGVDAGDAPAGLLRARAALVRNTSNTTAEREASHFDDPLERIWSDCLLGYCGVPRIERRVFRVVATSTAHERADWLAVVENADALDDQQLRAIAREFNQAETTFLLESTRSDCRLRSFTASGSECRASGGSAESSTARRVAEGWMHAGVALSGSPRLSVAALALLDTPNRRRRITVAAQRPTRPPNVRPRARL